MTTKIPYTRSSRPLAWKRTYGYGLLPNLKYAINNMVIKKPAFFDALCAHPPPVNPLSPHIKALTKIEFPEDRLRAVYLKRNPKMREIEEPRNLAGEYIKFKHPADVFASKQLEWMNKGCTEKQAYKMAEQEIQARQERIALEMDLAGREKVGATTDLVNISNLYLRILEEDARADASNLNEKVRSMFAHSKFLRKLCQRRRDAKDPTPFSVPELAGFTEAEVKFYIQRNPADAGYFEEIWDKRGCKLDLVDPLKLRFTGKQVDRTKDPQRRTESSMSSGAAGTSSSGSTGQSNNLSGGSNGKNGSEDDDDDEISFNPEDYGLEKIDFSKQTTEGLEDMLCDYVVNWKHALLWLHFRKAERDEEKEKKEPNKRMLKQKRQEVKHGKYKLEGLELMLSEIAHELTERGLKANDYLNSLLDKVGENLDFQNPDQDNKEIRSMDKKVAVEYLQQLKTETAPPKKNKKDLLSIIQGLNLEQIAKEGREFLREQETKEEKERRLKKKMEKAEKEEQAKKAQASSGVYAEPIKDKSQPRPKSNAMKKLEQLQAKMKAKPRPSSHSSSQEEFFFETDTISEAKR